MPPRRHCTHEVEGTRIHCVEEGEGPLVVMVHGFPESWYSWRHQLSAFAEAGYRCVAIDVRGYGRSSKPQPIEAYRMTELVGDVVGLIAALGESTATLIGHDWGAPIVWNTALLHPEKIRGVAGLSVPYHPRSDTRPTDGFRAMGGDEEFYISYFQEPGRAEAEIEPDVRGWLLGFLYGASGDVPPGTRSFATVAKGRLLRDRFVLPDVLPNWLSEEDLDFYAAEFERTGFTGGLNRYRNVDRDWQDFEDRQHAPIEVPSFFIGGSKDGPTLWGAAAIERFRDTLPDLRGCHILDGSGHWIQQERPEETNRLLLEFLASIH